MNFWKFVGWSNIMANFTNVQKIKIRWYLGYGVTYQQFNPYLEGAIQLAEQDADLVDLVVAQLAIIDSVNSVVAESLEDAGLKRVEDIEFYPDGQALFYQNKEGKKHVARLSILLGVMPNSDYFGTQGYQGVNNGYLPYGDGSRGGWIRLG